MVESKTAVKTKCEYQSGFGNSFETEALKGALPRGQNSPQKVPYGLYAEQLSGSAFTVARHENQRSWLYRIRPSVLHSPFKLIDNALFKGKPISHQPVSPEQWRWDPMPFPSPSQPTDFISGLVTIASNGGNGNWRGCAAHIYAINASMKERFFYNADGEMLFVPEDGSLLLKTELGSLEITAGEIAVIPRGIRFQVILLTERARGYVCENFGLPLRLPNLGVIGSNGLASARDFLSPCAAYEELEGDFQLITKFDNNLWSAAINHSPLNVVAWHGNYTPYKYDLSKFQVVNTVSFDHSDPSIFTVLSSPSEVPGIANLDFVIFPPRWSVADNTFRPPYYHRNVMSEFMGLIRGTYDAKQEGFVPGGASLHNCLSAHGPDAQTFAAASSAELKPAYLSNTLAFMFESSLIFQPTEFALSTNLLQKNYLDCWQGLQNNFDKNTP